MADTSTNNPTPNQQPTPPPLSGQELTPPPVPTAAPAPAENADATQVAKQERTEVQGTLAGATPAAPPLEQLAKEEIAAAEAGLANPPPSLETLAAAEGVVKPPALETSPAYQAQKAKEAEAAEAEAEAAREMAQPAEAPSLEALAAAEGPPALETSPAYQAQQMAKAVAGQMALKEGMATSEIEALTDEKNCSLAKKKYQGNLKEGLVKIFELTPENEISDEELAEMAKGLNQENLKDPDTLFAQWFNRLSEEGKKTPSGPDGKSAAAFLIAHAIKNDLSPLDLGDLS